MGIALRYVSDMSKISHDTYALRLISNCITLKLYESAELTVKSTACLRYQSRRS